MTTPETILNAQVVKYLRYIKYSLKAKGILLFYQRNYGGGIPIGNTGRFRSRESMEACGYRRGTCDIYLIIKKNKIINLYALELKSLKGKLSKEQIAFKQEFENYGEYRIIKSLKDLQDILGE